MEALQRDLVPKRVGLHWSIGSRSQALFTAINSGNNKATRLLAALLWQIIHQGSALGNIDDYACETHLRSAVSTAIFLNNGVMRVIVLLLILLF